MGSPRMPYEEFDLLEARDRYGWRDQLGEINVRGNGANDPVWTVIPGTEFCAFLFPNTGMKQFWHNTHIQHDYALLTEVLPHIHWFTGDAGTGNVVWQFKWVKAKGHGQEAYNFGSPTLIKVVQAAPGIQYQHMICEPADNAGVPGVGLEPDTIIKIRIFRDPTDAQDTYAGDVYADFADSHYKTNRFSTYNRSPDFYKTT